jgi:hypothetical protein
MQLLENIDRLLENFDGLGSKQRVADHGEVFTPAWMVEAMLDLVKGETERIDSRFLEPACGDGNFLVAVLRRKLAAVELKYGKSDFERRHYALLALMCIYGIELLTDNIAECRANLLAIFAEYLNLDSVGRPVSRRVLRAFAKPRPRRRPDDARPGQPADHLCRVGLSGQGPVPAARLSLRQPHPVIGLQRRRIALRPSRQARDFHAKRPTRP